ncbi:major facilitator superfamily domain-containing protein [Kockovaella imperatae]|uniref:Major facilitator superfamily domain-containing protein n=1 Tax=Kockovaella imperatae TaxID=4999 RepID=A0A1Y1UEE2_9TREE|nr:major facilitator superfamily domain-containing protein [Kockovaella imperatae]ORX36430.1 major facilitator superfamily domain-containing protein [Kockovaella imperatae]
MTASKQGDKPTYTSFSTLLRSPSNGGSSSTHPDRTLAPSRTPGSRTVSPTPPSRTKASPRSRLSIWSMLALTVSMGGSQIAWTVELGYGTPYLLSLGLSEQLTSLVWLAGPISGLVAQPLIGAISDSSNSRYRRRYWIVMATILLVLSGLGLAFTQPIAATLVAIFGGGQGSWDPKTANLVRSTSIAIAVTSFYCLDFALNGLQASLRNLVLDIVPGDQLASANAWHGRFNHFGNIVGFTMGFLNLNHVPIIRLVGGGQFRKVCIVALAILVLTVWITCWTQEEVERNSPFGRRSKVSDVISTIYEAVLHLPKPVRRVCIVQIAAFMGWFPYLFYSTTYVAHVMADELGHEPDLDKATRAGSLALLIYSFVAIVAGTLLPYLASRDRRLLGAIDAGGETDDEEADLEQIREQVRQWKAESARHGKPLKLPTMPFMLRNIWTAGLLLFAAIMASTFFIRTVWQATVAIALVGICWAIACWVPFAIIMEFLKEAEDSSSTEIRPRPPRLQSQPAVSRSQPTSPVRPNERTALTRSWSTADIEGQDNEYTGSGPVAGGTIMGIHNLAIVFPQFIIAIVASLIFKWTDGTDTNAEYSSKPGVAWVLRFGGLMALIGAVISRKVPPTKTEKAMRRRLAEMREESED